MRGVILFILTFIPGYLFCQLTETIVSDTNFIRPYVSSVIKGDTGYVLKNYRPLGKWIIYFDESKTKKAFEREYFNRNEDIYSETVWRRNGNIKSTRVLNSTKDTIYDVYYYPNNQVKTKNVHIWKNGGWGMIIDSSYYENGQIKQTPIDWPSFRKQHLFVYFENGKVQYELNWVMGAYVGEYKEWYENGNIKTVGSYTEKANEHKTGALQNGGIEVGIWKQYDENGKLIKEEVYDNGRLIKTTETK